MPIKTDDHSDFETLKGKGEFILIVDDVKEQRTIASAILSQLGYTADSVSNGDDALAYLKNRKVDLLIIDMIMDPGIDGYETFRQIIKAYPGQKAIIASGFSETETVRKTQALGAGAYIKKPYTIKKLGLAIKTELAGNR